MELRFVTFNSIILGNLMPWLDENQDLEKFMLILRRLSTVKNGQAGQFFETLPKVFSEMGINAGEKLTAEWELFAKITDHPNTPGIINPFLLLPDDNPKLLFYTSLITQNLTACFALFANSIAETNSVDLQKHRVMSSMKMICDLIIRTRELHPAGEADQAIIKRLLAGLAVLFLETSKRFPDLIEPSMLRISKSDIRSILMKTVNSDENTRALFTELSGRYFPVSGEQPKIVTSAFEGEEHKHPQENKSEADLEQSVIKTVLEEVEKTRVEISAMKQALAEAGKKRQPGTEIEDRRIGAAEACAILNISKSTLKAHRDNGDYSFTRIGSRYYYSLNEINGKMKMKKQQ
jgi:hypothetical protein